MAGMIVYLHGFASGPGSYKARLFLRRFAALGIDLLVPALDQGDFTHMTLTSQLRVVAQACAAAAPGEPIGLIGSSMGGYLAALHAAAHPAGIQALVLMAPAVDFARRWRERLGEADMARWQERGEIDVAHHALGRAVPLRYDLMEDAAQTEPWPQVAAPTLVVHGRRDDVVPQERVERWGTQNPTAQLVLYDAGHELTECADEIFERAREFLAEHLAQ